MMSNNKIKKTEEIKSIIKKFDKSFKIGLCHGVFDLIHLGHIKHFEEAKKKCDILFVSITSDKFVKKGPGRPAFNQNQRMEAVAALEFVDYVILSNEISSEKIISLIRPDFYFKGPDYKDNKHDLTKKIFKEKKSVVRNGGKIIYTSTIKFSSSSLIKNYLGIFSDQQKKEIGQIKKKFSFNKIKLFIAKAKDIKPLIIGETIIDQYYFTEAIGKSGKEPVLVLRELNNEKYLGGALAICNHLNSIVKKMFFLSYLGENKELQTFIKKNISNSIYPYFIYKKNSPTIVKKRFVDELSKAKVLGSYKLNDSPIEKAEENKLFKFFKKCEKKSDLIIISDYGHGLMNSSLIEKIKKTKKFIAVNAQVNSSNIGYHSLRNYKGVDCMIINENELRYEMRSKNEKLENLMKKLKNDLNIKNLIVTRGSSGVAMLNYQLKFVYCEAYAKKVIDKVGAGDSMLAILSLLIFLKVESKLSLFIASLCAAQKVSNIGNKYAIDKNQLLKEIEHIIS